MTKPNAPANRPPTPRHSHDSQTLLRQLRIVLDRLPLDIAAQNIPSNLSQLTPRRRHRHSHQPSLSSRQRRRHYLSQSQSTSRSQTSPTTPPPPQPQPSSSQPSTSGLTTTPSRRHSSQQPTLSTPPRSRLYISLSQSSAASQSSPTSTSPQPGTSSSLHERPPHLLFPVVIVRPTDPTNTSPALSSSSSSHSSPPQRPPMRPTLPLSIPSSPPVSPPHAAPVPPPVAPAPLAPTPPPIAPAPRAPTPPPIAPSPAPPAPAPQLRLPVPQHRVEPPRRRTHLTGTATPHAHLEILARAPFSCGPLSVTCDYCSAKFFSSERPNYRRHIHTTCCQEGTIQLPHPRCPPEFFTLFTENSPTTTQFLQHIRAVNSMFAMASFKTTAPRPEIPGQGRYSFNICGQVYHATMGVPNSQELRDPQLSHYYFLDAEEVLDRRNDFMANRLSPVTIRTIETTLRRDHRYVQAYRMMAEVLHEERQRRGGRRPVDDVIIAFAHSGNMNARRRAFDLPESRSEIAAVFYGTEPPFDVDLKLYPRTAAPPPPNDNNDEEPAAPLADRHHQIKTLNPMSDPLVYPLLFPYGEDGYSLDLRNEQHRPTMRQFYRYRVMIRDEPFSLIHNGGKLFQQYLVDAWVKIESSILWFYRRNQNRFRLAAQQVLRRTVARNPELANRVGRAVILPTSFQGGPRHLQRQYLDALAIVARHGKPDLFITFTCNPNWTDITDNLQYRQTPEHRPDIVCRVFKLKLLEFLDDVTKKQIYGRVQNYHYVIEFQKRGLPHAHIVVTFVPDDRIQTPEQVDDIVSATIPCPVTQPLLYALVARHQIHRPCGDMNPNALCMRDGRCSKFYPKPHSEHTLLVGGGPDRRPSYRRPVDGRSIPLAECRITNTRIVPYNPYALAKFHTHINFEVVGSLHSLKYLYKYVTKGPDCVTILANPPADHDPNQPAPFLVDEVRNYVDCRYVSSSEATWHLFEFKFHDRSHSVLSLPVHLPGEHVVFFDVGDDLERLDERLERRSRLEAWFALNASNPDARQFSYVQIPEHFTWHNQTGEWRPRHVQSKQIGHLVEITPRQENMELFYLRVLLRHVPGATSYESLRTVNGILLPTFQEACDSLNLLVHADEFDLCLRDAALMRSPRQMRRLFGLIITITTDQTIGQIPNLWRSHKNSLIEDYIRRGVVRRQALLECITYIQNTISRLRPDLRCDALGIVADDDDVVDDDDIRDGNDAHLVDRVASPPLPDLDDNDENDEDGYDVPRLLQRYDFRSLNVDQKCIFVRVVSAVCRTASIDVPADLFRDLDLDADTLRAIRPPRVPEREYLFFVDGPGGTGKTYLYNTLIAYVSGVLGLPVVSVAWTGIAANLLIGGRTVHSTFKLPLHLRADSTAGWPSEAPQSDALRRARLILWDEAPMTHRYAVESIDRHLRDISRVAGLPMGGKCSVFGGDFRQVLPVIPKGHRAALIDASIKCLPFWHALSQVRLSLNVRAARQAAVPPSTQADNANLQARQQLGDRSFPQWLLALGEGKLPYASSPNIPQLLNDLVEIPPLFHSPNLEDLLSFTYPQGYNSHDVGERAILSPTNAMANAVNDLILQSLDGEFRTYFSVDDYRHVPEDTVEIPLDILHSIDIPGLPPHELKLKVGAIVMLLRNLDVENGQCNGARMRITRLADHLIEGRLVTGQHKGRTVWLPKIQMIARASIIPQEILRTQFPVRPAYAMTINKAQGQTLKTVGIYLKRSCFAHGQLYVAFSRVGTPTNVRAYIEEGTKQGSFGIRPRKLYTRNVVYHSLLAENFDNQTANPPVTDDNEADDFGPFSLDDDFDAPPHLHVPLWNPPPNAATLLATHGTSSEIDYDDDSSNDYPAPARVTTVVQPPDHTDIELANRVSISDAPGTSGMGTNRRPQFRPPTRPRSPDSS